MDYFFSKSKAGYRAGMGGSLGLGDDHFTINNFHSVAFAARDPQDLIKSHPNHLLCQSV